MADPKCPVCAIEGIEHIRSTASTERSRTRQPWFEVVHCSNCGHVYGVLAKQVFSQPLPPRFVLPDPSG